VNENDQSQTTVDLARIPPPSLLFGLLSQRFTGRLEIDQHAPNAGARQVRFRGGMPTWTDWVQDGSRLGELAIAQGLASRAAIDVAVKAANGKRIGEQLVESGVLTQDKLAGLLRTQCMRRLLDLFALDGGEVRLVACNGDDDTSLLPLGVLELIHRGITARYDNTRVRRELGAAWNGRFRATPGLARYVEQFKFRAEDGSVIGYIASGAEATVAELSAMPDASPSRVAQLLGVLWHCQMIEGSAPGNERGPFDEDLAALEARIAAGDDPIAIIGVDNDADASTIDTAWLELAARFDPRSLGEEDEALRSRVVKVATTLRQVRDSARRRRLAIAEMTGLRLVADGKHVRGLALLEEAITLGATGPDIECALAWARLHTLSRGEAELQQADVVLARTIAAHPDVAAAHYYRGCVLSWLGKNADATKSLERALELDPRLVDAERQLRALARGDRPAEPAKSRKKADAPPPMVGRPARASTNPLLSPGYIRLYWFAGVLLVLMIAANIVLRLDADF
jgi:tetratricopeptide (TPR) repeat protein